MTDSVDKETVCGYCVDIVGKRVEEEGEECEKLHGVKIQWEKRFNFFVKVKWCKVQRISFKKKIEIVFLLPSS
jgi:hypothetical protein